MIASYTIKEANRITGGGLTQVSKMPEFTYNLPPHECKVGSKLITIEDSVCFGCYAFKGFFDVFKSTVVPAQYRRLASLSNEQWAPAMAHLINHYCTSYFRWHSAGDLQNVVHLDKIALVAKWTPDVDHWLPTREYKFVMDYLKIMGPFPTNLTVRLSAHMIDQEAPKYRHIGELLPTSTVHRHKAPIGFKCPAHDQGNVCDGRENGGINCRACWNPIHENVSYKFH